MSKSKQAQSKNESVSKPQRVRSSIETDPTPEDNPLYGEESHKNS